MILAVTNNSDESSTSRPGTQEGLIQQHGEFNAQSGLYCSSHICSLRAHVSVTHSVHVCICIVSGA